jgi:hypothetical protein
VVAVAKSEYRLQKISSDEWASWDSFVRNSPQGTVFQTTPYLNAFSSAFKRNIEILAVTENDELIAGLVVLPKKRGGIRYTTSPYLIPFNGIIMKDVSTLGSYLKKVKFHQRVVSLIQQELEKRFHYSEIYLASSIMDIRSFIWQNWHIQPDYSINIPLQDHDNLIDGLPHNQRRHIRKFEKSEFTLEESQDYEICYNLMYQSYRHHGIKPPIEQQNYTEFVSLLFKNKLQKTYLISIAEKAAAFMIVIEDKPLVYALFSGKNFKQEQSEAELYLHWRLLQLYQDKSYDSFNLLGAMSPSISRVKLELGGRLVRQDIGRYFKNGIIRLLLQAESIRQLRNRRNL